MLRLIQQFILITVQTISTRDSYRVVSGKVLYLSLIPHVHREREITDSPLTPLTLGRKTVTHCNKFSRSVNYCSNIMAKYEFHYSVFAQVLLFYNNTIKLQQCYVPLCIRWALITMLCACKHKCVDKQTALERLIRRFKNFFHLLCTLRHCD